MTEELIDRLRAMYVANGTNYVQAAADKLEAQAERIKFLEADRNLEKKMRKDADEYADTLRAQLAEIAASEPVGHISNQDTHDGRELIKIFANDAGRSLPRGKHLLFTRPVPAQLAEIEKAEPVASHYFDIEGNLYTAHRAKLLKPSLNGLTPLFTRPMPAQPIIGLQAIHDAITADPTLADCAQDVTEFDESQFKSVEDLIAHLNKLNSYRDRTLEALSKYKGAKGGCITQFIETNPAL